MPQDTRHFLHLLISLFCIGTFIQLISAALIYSHSLSKIISATPISQPELITTFLYLFIAGTILQLFSTFSIYTITFTILSLLGAASATNFLPSAWAVFGMFLGLFLPNRGM
jgi:TRAP-type C4-dicarboxylate transport system permease small subunit